MFQRVSIGLLAGVFACGLTSVSRAGDVTIKGVHLCCGSCDEAALGALKGVKGVTKPGANRDSKLISFHADDAAAATAGLNSLAKAGFYGTATHDGQKLAFPASGAKPGAKQDQITLTGLHLCCTACVEGAKEAFEKVPGVAEIQVDRSGKSVKLVGTQIDVNKAVDALNEHGFFGTVK